MSLDPAAYGPVLGSLIDVDRRRPLDEGSPTRARASKLTPAALDEVFAHTAISDANMARCCLAGLWLLYDELDRSHQISQGVATPSGSFWHGIMHRREGDFSNAKYWFRRVGDHEVYAPLAERAAECGQQSSVVDQVASGGLWDAFAFVDACQSAVTSGSDVAACQTLQQLEWELLFDFCYQRAVGG